MTDPIKLQLLEHRLAKLDKVNLNGAKNSNNKDLNIGSFEEWTDIITRISNPDVLRTALYGLFQPLYDRLVESPGPFSSNMRPHAIQVMNTLHLLSSKYLKSFYFGEPNIKGFQKGIRPHLEKIAGFDKESKYETKTRNMSNDSLTPSNLQSFIITYREAVLKGVIPFPDFIMGIACGSSEIAYATAAIMGSTSGFVRMSYTRKDTHVKMICEDQEGIATKITGHNVAVVEDFICSAQSMRDVLLFVEDHNPVHSRGFSIRENSNKWEYLVSDMKVEIERPNFYVFTR